MGSFTANDHVLKDMLGNVSEWTCSSYEAAYGEEESQCADQNDSRLRVIRGGSCVDGPWNLRSADRYGIDATRRNFDVGFRASRTP